MGRDYPPFDDRDVESFFFSVAIGCIFNAVTDLLTGKEPDIEQLALNLADIIPRQSENGTVGDINELIRLANALLARRYIVMRLGVISDD